MKSSSDAIGWRQCSWEYHLNGDFFFCIFRLVRRLAHVNSLFDFESLALATALMNWFVVLLCMMQLRKREKLGHLRRTQTRTRGREREQVHTDARARARARAHEFK